jgi:alginate O-acetyltransferase complex protein AlgI
MSANMGGASVQFLGFAAIVAIAFNLGARSIGWRQAVLLLASLSFLLFFSLNPLAYLPFVGFLLFGFLSLRLMQRGVGSAAFVTILVAGIAAFIWLKKYTFIPSPLLLPFSYFTLGLSYIFFRVLHLIIDAKDGGIPEKVGLVSYLNYTLNFTTLVSGPIQRYQDFAAMHLAPVPLPLNIVITGEAIERIVVGFFKVNVLSLALSAIHNQAIANLSSGMTLTQRVLNGIVIGSSYPVYLYCNFSGYIDMVIGIARFIRIELPENFRRPFASDNFMNFWSRWHITLSEWLKTYVYNPVLIALMRRFPSASAEPFLGVFAFFVTFFLVGVWHGQTPEFLFFGVLQGGGVSAVKFYQVLMTKWLGKKQYRAFSNNPVYNAFARGLTFTWFAFTLLWFWSSSTQLKTILKVVGPDGFVIACGVVFLGATLVLAAWEALREQLLSWRRNDTPILTTRYARTAWGTALIVITAAVIGLLNAPAPDIVYKGF